MSGELIYAFRVMRLPLLDAGGAQIGRLDDIVVIPGRAGKGSDPAIPPRVVGFVASSQRRSIFVNANRIADARQRRRSSAELGRRPQPVQAPPRRGADRRSDLIDRKIGDETVSDIALREQIGSRSTFWVIDRVRLSRKSTLRRRPSYRLVDYDEVPALFDAPTEMQAEAARLRDFHPAEVAAVVRALPVDQRRQLAEAMDDERLADVLEELSEEEQIRIVSELDLDRLVGVFDEMEYDDLADLIGRDGARRSGAHARRDGRRRRRRDPPPARIRRGHRRWPDDARGDHPRAHRRPCRRHSPRSAIPTGWSASPRRSSCASHRSGPRRGSILGVAHVQRLLREPPSMELGRLLADDPTLEPDDSDRHVAERLASYDLLAMAVCDEAGRLLGAVTVDDVIDRMLGVGWRTRARTGRDTAEVPDMRRREDLHAPRAERRVGVGVQYDSDRFGAFSESIARYLGTAQFLVWQTIVIALWIVHNTFAPDQLQFDPWSRGLVLLTLVLSLQASYAAPLILLAQNRQEFRDRLTAETDRNVAERTQADTEFLAREIAGVRLSLSDMVTGETLDERLETPHVGDRAVERSGRRC